MQRSTNGAREVYIYQLGRHASRDDMVNIFDDADPADIVTVAAQRESYRIWQESVRSPRPE
jgi:hypothetical protein